MSEITVVGCGAMGSRLINAFMECGHDVVIVDSIREKAEPFIARGARFSETLQDAPETETFLINVPHNMIARSIIESCSKERLTGKYFINTTGAATMDEVRATSEVAESYELHYLDAKIEAYPETVGRETGYMVYAGDRETFEKNKDLLAALGKATYIGEDPAWAWLSDMAVIGVHGGAMFALYEIAALCLKHGYPLEKMCQVVKDTMPPLMEINYEQITNELKNYDGTFSDYDSTDIIIEERGSRYVFDALVTSGIHPIIHDHMMDIYLKMLDNGYGRKSMAAVVNYMMGKINH